MDATEFAEVATRFATLHRHFAPCFGRREARQRSEQYLRGLLVQQADRRNAENVVGAVAGATPRTLQRFLTAAPWEHEAVLAAPQTFLAPRLNDPGGVFILDERAFPKQGDRSAGVARQWCGTLGKAANCQVGVFLAYASGRGQALIDAQLYLPEAWAANRDRCQAAGVPDDVAFETKADLGLALRRRARERGGARRPRGGRRRLVRPFHATARRAGRRGLVGRPGRAERHGRLHHADRRRATAAAQARAPADPPAARPRRRAAPAGGRPRRRPPRGRLGRADGGGRRAGAAPLPVRGAARLGEPRRPPRPRRLAPHPAQPGRQRRALRPGQRPGGHPAAHAGGGRRDAAGGRDPLQAGQRGGGAGAAGTTTSRSRSSPPPSC